MNIFLRTIKDRKVSVILYIIGLFLFSLLLFYVYIQFGKEKAILIQFTRVYQNMPFVKLFTGGKELDLTSIEGFINTQYLLFIAPLIFIMYAIAYFSDAIAGEEERKTIEIILVSPIRRGRFLIEKFMAGVFLVIIIAIFNFIGFYIGQKIFNISMNNLRIFSSLLSCALLSITTGSISLLVSSIFGDKGLSISIASVYTLISYIVNSMSNLVSIFDRIKIFSLFFYYSQFSVNSIYVFLFIIFLLLFLSILFFNNRDISL